MSIGNGGRNRGVTNQLESLIHHRVIVRELYSTDTR